MVQTNSIKKRKVLIVFIIAFVIVGLYVVNFFIYTKADNLATQPYTKQVGDVDVEYFTNVSNDFKIMADKNGVAVFENPRKAMLTLYLKYFPEIIKLHLNLEITQPLFKYHQTINPEFLLGSENMKFIVRFMDIYENSFSEE